MLMLSWFYSPCTLQAGQVGSLYLSTTICTLKTIQCQCQSQKGIWATLCRQTWATRDIFSRLFIALQLRNLDGKLNLGGQDIAGLGLGGNSSGNTSYYGSRCPGFDSPLGAGLFLSSLSYHKFVLYQAPCGGAKLLIFLLKKCLAVQLEAKQA